jgi:hypothetical protein
MNRVFEIAASISVPAGQAGQNFVSKLVLK